MSDRVIEYTGVTFVNLQAALCATYFLHNGMSQDEWRRALGYVIPMQHNFENPIKPGTQDTWIQFMIDDDDRMTQDYNSSNENKTFKVARVTLRFLGRRAEVWAKAFHHLTKRRSVATFFHEYCNATMLEYVSSITPVNVDYFGANVSIAHDLTFDLQYEEVMCLDDAEPLNYISFPQGDLIIEGNIDVAADNRRL
jgi:hypothetical protein